MTTADLSALLDNIQAMLRRYVVLNEHQQTTVTLWTAHTHAIDAAESTPYLNISSAMKGSGKTRMLEVLEPIVARAWLTGRTSASALVRKVDRDHPTLLLDESDATFAGEKEYAEALRGVLNTGYRHSGKATLCVGKGANIGIRDFSTFCPKAIAGIGALPDTVAHRSISIELHRRTSDEPCDRWRERDGHQQATPLHDGLAAWAERSVPWLQECRPGLPSELGDRQADVWEPLLAIASLAGGDWPARAWDAAVILSRTTEDTDVLIELLGDLAAVLRNDDRDAVPTKELLAILTAREDGPWATWRNDKPITARGLARLLGRLRIYPANLRSERGYRIPPLRDVFRRYLPSDPYMCHAPNDSGPDSTNPIRHNGERCDGSLFPVEPSSIGSVTLGRFGKEEEAL
jgi:hypothetical protein